MENSHHFSKELSNPFSTGGGGFHFESHVQASFVVLMLACGFVPCLPTLPIKKIKLQRRVDGFNTDDLIIFMERGSQRQKLLGQIKHTLNFTAKDPTFREVIRAAWRDYQNSELFIKRQDAIAIITGPLSETDIHGARSILEWASVQETFCKSGQKGETSVNLSIARKKDNRWSYKMIAQNTSKGISWKYCQRAVWSA